MRLRLGWGRVGVAARLQMPQEWRPQVGGLRDGALLRADVGRLGELSLREERTGRLPGQQLTIGLIPFCFLTLYEEKYTDPYEQAPLGMNNLYVK